jgi:hypothetical protein
MASIIVDQVSGAIGQVALKNSRFNREGAIGGLESARKLARKLFGALSDVYPPRSHLIVEGPSRTLVLFLLQYLECRLDFHPYFHTTAEAVSFYSQLFLGTNSYCSG